MKTCKDPGPPTVLIRREKSALHLILNHPETINSLTWEMLQKIAGETEKAQADKSIKLIILSGNGVKGFCAGGDIKLMAQAVTKNDIEPVMSFLKVENGLDQAIYNFRKPVVVFAHG
ncbi:MAG: enoyl-CoA hydratase/isomerase family protein, partial [Syntrophales bacterium]